MKFASRLTEAGPGHGVVTAYGVALCDSQRTRQRAIPYLNWIRAATRATCSRICVQAPNIAQSTAVPASGRSRGIAIMTNHQEPEAVNDSQKLRPSFLPMAFYTFLIAVVVLGASVSWMVYASRY